MIHETPIIHVGFEHTYRNSAGYTDKIIINLSRIPQTASDDSIRQMMDRAQVAIGLMMEQACRTSGVLAPKVATINFGALDEADYCEKCGSQISETGQCGCADLPASTLTDGLASMLEQAGKGADAEESLTDRARRIIGEDIPAYDPFAEGEPLAHEAIPHESEVETHLYAFGVKMSLPPSDWHKESITLVNADGEGGGQMVAVNAALTGIGYGGAKRHRTAQAILDQIGSLFGEPVTQVTSIHDLTKAEAHLILTFIDNATPASLNDLYRAVMGVAV